MLFPIPVSQLYEWIPHRPPMVWIDEVLSVNADGGECRVYLKQAALYLDAQGIRQTSLIECLAQSFGYVRAAQQVCGLIPPADPASRALLVSVRKAVFHLAPPDLKHETSLRFEVNKIKAMDTLLFFEGVAWTEDNRRIFEARMMVYSDGTRRDMAYPPGKANDVELVSASQASKALSEKL